MVRSLKSVFLGGMCAIVMASGAYGQVKAIDIPAGDLKFGLDAYIRQSGVQLIYSADDVRAAKTAGVHGALAPEEALKQLLAGTDLVIQRDTSGAIVVTRENRIKKAQAASNEAANPEKRGVETVVVTAEKRVESRLDVPMALTVLGGEDLTKTHSFRLEDFVGRVPGVTLVAGGGVSNSVQMRGLTTGSDIVGGAAIYLDETSYLPASPTAGGAFDKANFDTYDLARVEVLKGPQGTLYGANAQGGLIKYVTNAPDLSGFSATVQAGVSTVYAGGSGFDIHGMVNIPLADDLALRLVAYDDYYPGYIDDPTLGRSDINGSRIIGGRASLLWQPTQDLSIRLNTLYQQTQSGVYYETASGTALTPTFGPLIQGGLLIPQPDVSPTYAVNLTVNWDLRFATLVSASSFHRGADKFTLDLSPGFGGLTPLFFTKTYGVALPVATQYDTVAQEVRLSSEGGGPLHWQIGGYLTEQNSVTSDQFCPFDLATRQIECSLATNGFLGNGSPLGSQSEPVSFREYAVFANVDYNLTPDLDVALGGRYSYNHQAFSESNNGPLLGSAVIHQKPSQGEFTYSGDIRWHLTPESVFYLRIATGYAPGGANPVVPSAPPGIPRAYQSSTTYDYESGVKSTLLDDHLTAELALYHIVWSAIPVFVTVATNFTEAVNAGTAYSDGVEWQFNYVPIQGLTLGLNGDYDDAHFTKVLPGVVTSFGANAGDRLPNTPLWQVALSADYERRLFGNYSGFVGVDERFMGSRPSVFVVSAPRAQLPSYGIFDLRAGIESDSYSFTVYAANLGNTVTPIAGNAPNATISQPRTIGVTLAAKF